VRDWYGLRSWINLSLDQRYLGREKGMVAALPSWKVALEARSQAAFRKIHTELLNLEEHFSCLLVSLASLKDR
jgi:hypothetical protein